MSTGDRISATTNATTGDGHEDDPQALHEQIERTRAELGDTVQALSEKTDVRARASEKVQDTKAHVRDRGDSAREQAHEKVEGAKEQAQTNQVPIAVVVGGALALAAIGWSRRS